MRFYLLSIQYKTENINIKSKNEKRERGKGKKNILPVFLLGK